MIEENRGGENFTSREKREEKRQTTSTVSRGEEKEREKDRK